MSIKKISGLIISAIIICVGIYLLISNLGILLTEIDETIDSGISKSYKIYSVNHSEHHLKISGEKFDLELTTPEDGLQIPKTSHSNEVDLSWVHLEDGYSLIVIENTGLSNLQVIGTFERATEPFFFILTFIIIIVGMIIIGFVLNFDLRNKK